jgi:hypothetical protein
MTAYPSPNGMKEIKIVLKLDCIAILLVNAAGIILRLMPEDIEDKYKDFYLFYLSLQAE